MFPSVPPAVPYTENYIIAEPQFITTSSSCELIEREFPEYAFKVKNESNPFVTERLLDETKYTNIIVADFSVSKYDFERMECSEVLKQLNTVFNLPDNWDSYGSPKLSRELFENARSLVKYIGDSFLESEPDVVPVSGGGVQFEWQFAGRELEIEFSDTFQVEYLKVCEDESMEEDAFPVEKIAEEVPKLFTWLFSNDQ